jgi:hypothetical protein
MRIWGMLPTFRSCMLPPSCGSKCLYAYITLCFETSRVSGAKQDFPSFPHTVLFKTQGHSATLWIQTTMGRDVPLWPIPSPPPPSNSWHRSIVLLVLFNQPRENGAVWNHLDAIPRSNSALSVMGPVRYILVLLHLNLVTWYWRNPLPFDSYITFILSDETYETTEHSLSTLFPVMLRVL